MHPDRVRLSLLMPVTAEELHFCARDCAQIGNVADAFNQLLTVSPARLKERS